MPDRSLIYAPLRSLSHHRRILVLSTGILLCCAHSLLAQGNYEIQVYGADTVPPKTMMVALHSNFTAKGQPYDSGGVYATNHQQHETIEITQGLTSWSEVGFYIFTSMHAGHAAQWVGAHIPPRVRVPASSPCPNSSSTSPPSPT